MDESETLVVITTTDSAEAAEALGRGLVEARLAACVQISGPVRSVYRWDGETQVDTEWQCWIKTAADRYPDLAEWIATHHSYDVPEIVALPVVAGSAEYLTWVTDQTRG